MLTPPGPTSILLTDLLFGWSVAVGVGVAVLGFLVWVWFAIPVSRRVRDESGDD